MPFPTPSFTPWFPWSHIDGGTPPAIAAKLGQVGCYLVARSDAAPAPGPADPADAQVFYIGETHGNTTSLWGRLSAFGNSAGFYGGQWNGHYGAWGYPDQFPQDVLGPGAGGHGKSCTSAHVFVALCAWPGGLPAQMRGIFPSAIEVQAIWAHAEARGAIPALNNSGRVRTAPTMPPVTDAELDAMLAQATSPGPAEAAALAVTQRFAVEMRYQVGGGRASRMSTYGNWYGAERPLGTGEYLYIGWSSAQPDHVTVSGFVGHHAAFDGGASATRTDLLAALQGFWDYWNP